MATQVNMDTIADANRSVRQLVENDLLPRLGDAWKSRSRKGSAECYRVASQIHVELIRIGTRRRGNRFSVGVGIAVRYPLQHWLMTLGGTSSIGSTSIGYHVGLRHHSPGQDEWWMDAADWKVGVISDVEQYAPSFFSSMATPKDVIDLLRTTRARERLFTLGGPEEEVRTVATMYYAYIDQQKGIDELLAWLEQRDSRLVRQTLEFLESKPLLPTIDLTQSE